MTRRTDSLRRGLRRIGTALIALILVIGLGSALWTIGYNTGAGQCIAVGGGAIQYSEGGLTNWNTRLFIEPSAYGWFLAFVPGQITSTGAFGSWRLWTFPLWIPLVVIGIPTLLLWHVEQCSAPPGYCQTCTYDLTGNTSGFCPECGAATREPS